MTKSFVPSVENQRAFRTALGSFATGVTVVSTQTDTGPVGMTVNSFSSVSLDPPLILWSLAKDSDRYEAFRSAEQVSIQILRHDQTDLAMAFAERADAFDAHWQTGTYGAPVLSDCLCTMQYKTAARHDAGDHVILIGKVLQVDMRDGAPLVFAGGGFGSFSEI